MSQSSQLKQFRFISDELRKSVRNELSLKFSKEEKLFLDVLAEKGYSGESKITKNSDIIPRKSLLQQNRNKPNDEVLPFLIEQVEQHNQICTSNLFVDKIIDTIRNLHLDNQEDQVEIDTLITYQKTLNQVYDRIASLSLTFQPPITQSFLEIYHIQSNENATDIFKHYKFLQFFLQNVPLQLLTRIKYRARVVYDETTSSLLNEVNKGDPIYKSIYEQRSGNLWREIFSEKANQLEIIVLGKRKMESSKENGFIESKENYIQISKVCIDFKLIYACIHPKALEESVVKTEVRIQFQDQKSNAPYKGLTSIQIGFNFILNTDTRLIIMDKLLEYFCATIDKLNYQISQRTDLIQEILQPFSHKIQYKHRKGLEENKLQSNRISCSVQQCNIF